MIKEKNPYKIFNHYCLRTPLFPINYFFELTNKENISDQKLKEVFKNRIFNEALYLASPELYNQALKWYDGNITDNKKQQRIKLSILKYITRICSRCTPFGLFAACGHGQFSSETKIKIKSFENYSRLDVGYLSSLVLKILEKNNIKNRLFFYPNSSIYKIGNHYRYIIFELNDNFREYYLEGFNSSKYIENVIEQSKFGKTLPEFAKLIVSKEIDYDESISFINKLVDEQILVSELELSVTGKHYHENLLEVLNKISKRNKTSKSLQKEFSELKFLNINENSNISFYKRIHSPKHSLISKNKNIFQTDCFLNLEYNNLHLRTQKKLIKTLNLFNKITLNNSNNRIDEFKTSFLKRYEQSEVPLALALDSEMGLGYGNKMNDNSSLINDIPTNINSKKYKEIIWTEFDQLIHIKLFEVLTNNSLILTINDSDVESLATDWQDLPDTFSSIIELYDNDLIFMNRAGGSTALNLIGRFCYGNSELMSLGKQIAQIEDKINSDKIIAEIVHVPQHRTVNILHRPSFRKYEISYLAKSSVDKKHQISINDILISIKNDKIILRSKKLNKEILPRLSNAHDFSSNSLPIYQFLCELQTENKRSYIGFTWNNIFFKYPFLPRVEYEGVIISKAKWNINVSDFKKLVKLNLGIKNVSEFKKKLRLPKLVQLVDSGNKLLINLENITSVEMLYDSVKTKKTFQLEEFLFNRNGIVKKNNGSFCNQFVVSFYKNSL